MCPEELHVYEHSNARKEQSSKEITNWFDLQEIFTLKDYIMTQFKHPYILLFYTVPNICQPVVENSIP